MPVKMNKRSAGQVITVLEVKKIRLDRSGCFEIRREVVSYGSDKPMEWEMAYSIHGDYIGTPQFARHLAKHGIVPELAKATNRVCSVGYSPKTRQWYGWSHRACVGFKIGDRIFDADMPGATDKTPFKRHGTQEIRTLEEARVAACNFAEYVS